MSLLLVAARELGGQAFAIYHDSLFSSYRCLFLSEQSSPLQFLSVLDTSGVRMDGVCVAETVQQPHHPQITSAGPLLEIYFLQAFRFPTSWQSRKSGTSRMSVPWLVWHIRTNPPPRNLVEEHPSALDEIGLSEFERKLDGALAGFDGLSIKDSPREKRVSSVWRMERSIGSGKTLPNSTSHLEVLYR